MIEVIKSAGSGSIPELSNILYAIKEALDETNLELKRTRKGHEMMLWGQEVELSEEEEE